MTRAALAVSTALMSVAGTRVDAASGIGVSRDGITWSDRLADPLFDSALRWVPGDRRSTSLFIRNETDDAALLSIDVVSDTDGRLASGDFTISADSDDGTATVVDTGGTRRLLDDVRLAPRTATEVVVAVTFDSDSANSTQTTTFDVRFDALLVQDTTGTTATAPDGTVRLLPAAGGDVAEPLVVGGAAAVTLGVIAAAASYRRLHRA